MSGASRNRIFRRKLITRTAKSFCVADYFLKWRNGKMIYGTQSAPVLRIVRFSQP
jgi:hypothetical protein